MASGAWVNYSYFKGGTGGGPSFGLEVGGLSSVPSTLLAWGAGYALFLVGLSGIITWFPRPIRWLGMISYSVYLMHPVLLAVTRGQDIPHWLALTLMLGGTLVLATITYTFVEKPMIEIGRRVQERYWPMRKKKKAAPA